MSQPSRVQRSDFNAALSYLWEVPGKPVSVRLTLDLIDRLERAAVENFRSIDARGSEIGGLLFGEASPAKNGAPATVAIEDYELITCDYSRGPLYRLSDADLERFDAAIERRKAAGGSRVVGFFRSHTRKGLALDADDMAVLETRFRDSLQVTLLVRPFATKASSAGIFIWESGKMRGEASYQEFPFQTSQLAAQATAVAPVQAAPAPPAPVQAAPAAAAPAAPKPPARGPQVVPMTPRAKVSPPSPPPAAPVQVAQSAALPGLGDGPLPRGPIPEEPAEKQAKVEEKSQAEPAVTREKVAAPKAEEAHSFEAPPPETGRKLPWMWISIGAALAVCSGALFIYPGIARHPNRTPSIPAGLTLRVERTATDVLLTWNRDSEAIRNATGAVLSITDGDRQENVKMSLADLRNGSIMYSPLTPDTSFRMEVTGPDGQKAATEIVRMLRPERPSPMPSNNAQSKTPAAVQTANSQPAQAATPTTAAGDEQQAAEDAPDPSEFKRPTRTFNMESLAGRLRPATSADLPSAPAPSLQRNASNNALASLGALGSSQSIPVPAVKEVNPPAANRAQQAQLVSRVEPQYPELARRRGISGEVRLALTVGKDGKIKNVRALSGPIMLQTPAMDAVKRWVYRPAMLNGTPTDSEKEVVLNFALK